MTKDMLGRTSLIPVQDAQSMLMKHLSEIPRHTEKIEIEHALYRVLAEPVHSTENLPPHPRSVMDGYAVCSADTFGASESMPCYLQITGNVAMGEMPEGVVKEDLVFVLQPAGSYPKGQTPSLCTSIRFRSTTPWLRLLKVAEQAPTS